MILKQIEDRAEELDLMLAHPKIEHRPHPTITQSFFREISLFLNNPKNDDLFDFLFRKLFR